MPEPVRVKKHPKFVHGKVGSAMLLHKVQYVEARWYAYGVHEFIRLQHPSLAARAVCGAWFHLEAGRAGVCELPAPPRRGYMRHVFRKRPNIRAQRKQSRNKAAGKG